MDLTNQTQLLPNQLITWANHLSNLDNGLVIKRLAALIFSLLMSACDHSQTPDPINKAKQNKQTNQNFIEDSPYGIDSTFEYPNFSGRYSVASLEMTVTDHARVETLEKFPLDGQQRQITPRKFNLRFYYPSANSPIEHLNIGLNADEQIKMATTEKLPVINKISWTNFIGPQMINGKMLRYSNYENAFWNIRLNQKLSNQQSEFPILIFSHGYGYSPEAYSALSAELASQGYIVVSINHTFGANPTVLKMLDSDHNESIKWAKKLPREDLSRYLQTWSDDQIYTIEELIKLNGDFESPFYNRFNLNQLGIFGHSYGGAASYLTAARDPRIKAVMDIDGTLFEAKEFDLYQPFAFIYSKNHQPEFNKNKLNDESFLIQFKQFEHISFTDHILWWQWDHGDVNLNNGEINSLDAVETTASAVKSFFDTYLLENNSWQEFISTQNKAIKTQRIK